MTFSGKWVWNLGVGLMVGSVIHYVTYWNINIFIFLMLVGWTFFVTGKIMGELVDRYKVPYILLAYFLIILFYLLVKYR